MGDIEEDDDVYFECSVKANPRTYKMVWLHEVSEGVKSDEADRKWDMIVW